MATEPEAAAGYRPGGPVPATRTGRRGFVAIGVLVLGLAGLAASAVGVGMQLLPRHFTAAQQRQIMAWQVARRWRVLPAGTIFPASVRYAPPAVLGSTGRSGLAGSSLTLTARRLAIAPQARCAAAADRRLALALTDHDCEAVLRATYADDTDSFVVTVGVAAFPGTAQAAAAERELPPPAASPGVRTVRVAGTPAAGFTDSRRQFSASIADGPYLVMYTIGYANGRPRVPLTADSYADAEMTSMGTGVAETVGNTLGAQPPPPHCPGAPGC